MTTREAIIAVAKTLLRLEIAEHGGSNKGEVVSKLLFIQGGHDGDPWCAAFYAFCYELGHDLAGTKRTYDPGLSTSQNVPRAKVANRLTPHPQGGDAVCFIGDAYGTGYEHTAMFLRWVDEANGTYETIEGNVGNAVQKRQHTIKDRATFISCE
jgi:hypothetical protein